MASEKNRWYIKKEHYLNVDDYNVCMQPGDSRLPSVCIGCFQGIEQLKGFADLLKRTIESGQIAEDIREAYVQIIDAISKEEAALCG